MCVCCEEQGCVETHSVFPLTHSRLQTANYLTKCTYCVQQWLHIIIVACSSAFLSLNEPPSVQMLRAHVPALVV